MNYGWLDAILDTLAALAFLVASMFVFQPSDEICETITGVNALGEEFTYQDCTIASDEGTPNETSKPEEEISAL